MILEASIALLLATIAVYTYVVYQVCDDGDVLTNVWYEPPQ